ncbi:hypothetical protein D9M71_353950 [compost metagenome]
MGDGDDHVVAFFKRVGVALGQGELEHHLRVELAITGDERRHQHAQAGQAMQAQRAAGLEVGTAGFFGGLGHVLENLPGAQQEALAGFGQAQASSRSVQQTGLHMLFKVRDQARNLRRGKIQGLCSGGKASGIGDPHEYPQAVEHVHQPSGGNDWCKSGMAAARAAQFFHFRTPGDCLLMPRCGWLAPPVHAGWPSAA